jgi:drug/metabolite transporter (DMT)-like permease
METISQARPTALIYLLLSALIGISAGDTIYIKGLKMINISVAFPLAQSTWPIFTLAAAVLLLGESITWSLVLGTALVIGGAYMIAAPEGINPPFRHGLTAQVRGRGITFILLASIFWAFSISLLKLGLEGVDLILANGIRLPIATLVLLPMALGQRKNIQPSKLGIREVSLGIFTGVLSFGLGGILFLLAIQNAGAGKAAVLTSSAPLFGLPLSIIFLKESVTPRVLWGTGLAVSGLVFLA